MSLNFSKVFRKLFVVYYDQKKCRFCWEFCKIVFTIYVIIAVTTGSLIKSKEKLISNPLKIKIEFTHYFTIYLSSTQTSKQANYSIFIIVQRKLSQKMHFFGMIVINVPFQEVDKKLGGKQGKRILAHFFTVLISSSISVYPSSLPVLFQRWPEKKHSVLKSAKNVAYVTI